MRKLILIFFFFFLTIFFTNAQFDWDCKYIWKIEDYEKDILKLKLSQLNPNCIKIAFENLRNYCKCKKEWNCSSYVWAESSFLLDHLFDVGFRMLDAFDDRFYPGCVDSDAIQYREKLKEYELDYKWVQPQKIYDLYFNYRNQDDGILYRKYINLCNDIKKIYDKLLVTSWYWKGNTDLKLSSENVYGYCLKMFLTRSQKEQFYISQLMILKWNELAKYRWKNYVLKDMIVNLWPALLEDFSKMVGYFTRIVKLIWDGTKNCNK